MFLWTALIDGLRADSRPGSLIKESTSLETEPDVFNASLITKRAGVLEAHVQLAAALGKHVPNLIIILGNNND